MKELAPADRFDQSTSLHMSYRADIDGLRAVAVVPVVLNHAGVRGVWGGFVGVDIFFVISGFLITTILLRDLDAGRYSITDFYRRRVLRIFPALFVMLACTTILAATYLLPGETARYGVSLMATAVFASNVFFWSEAGYFAPAARMMPLLHTWSLAIEEQFYIIWPLLLASVRFRGSLVKRTLVVVVVSGSLAIAVWSVQFASSSAFYLLPSRAWELGLGAVLAISPYRVRSRLLNEALAGLGLALTLFAMHRFTEATPFPGLAALLPCGGAALLIMTGDRGTLIGRLFSSPPLTFLGRISYSLYLWHWPIIVFSELGLFLPHTGLVVSGEIVLSIFVAWISWVGVEQPFRHSRSRWPSRYVLAVAVSAIALAMLVGVVLIVSQGWAARFSSSEQRVAAYQDQDHDALYRGGICFLLRKGDLNPRCLRSSMDQRPTLLLVGDSHGAQLWPGLARYQSRLDILQATHAGCKPVLYTADIRSPCAQFFRDIFTQWLPSHHVDYLVIAARWRSDDLAVLDQTLKLPAVRAAHPLLIGPVPQYTTSLPRLLVFSERRKDPMLPDRATDKDVFETDVLMTALARRTGIPYASPTQVLCRAGHCRQWAKPGVPMQFDYGHLTSDGSAVVTDAVLAPMLNSAIKGR